MYIFRSLSHFLFPPFCMGCHTPLEKGFTSLCRSCMEALTLIDPHHMCLRCGSLLSDERHTCQPAKLEGCATCFEESLPASALLRTSGEAISPFVVMQWNALSWPLPDLVIPTPGDWLSSENDRWSLRKEIAKSVAALISRRYLPALTLRRHHLHNTLSSLETNVRLNRDSVRVSAPKDIVNTTVLLIHDQKMSGAALNISAEVLKHHGARAIFGISVV